VRDLRIDTGSGNVVLDVTAAPSVHLVVLDPAAATSTSTCLT